MLGGLLAFVRRFFRAVGRFLWSIAAQRLREQPREVCDVQHALTTNGWDRRLLNGSYTR